jgi:hypothetical protein
MTLRLLFAILFFNFGIFVTQAQTQSIQIKWIDPVPIQINELYQQFSPWFEDATIDYNRGEVPLLNKVYSAYQQGQQIELVNISTEALTRTEQQHLRGIEVGTDWDFTAFTQNTRGKTAAGFSMLAIRKNPESGVLEKLSSVTIRFVMPAPGQLVRRKTDTYAENSVLANGTWYRIAVENTGVFRITPSFLRDLGVSVNNINSANIRIFGNGGGMLPENTSSPRIDDLKEIPLLMQDGGDGIFDGNDAAYFYATGPHRWRLLANVSRFVHALNLYSDRAFYFITIDNGPGARITQAPDPGISNPDYTTSTFDDYAYVEEDRVNLLKSGRIWFGDVFDFQLSYNYSFNFPNIVTTEPAIITLRAAARTLSSGPTMQTRYNNNVILTNTFVPYNPDFGFATLSEQAQSFQPVGAVIPLNVSFNNSANPSAVAWLDYIRIQVRRNLITGNSPLFFRDIRAIGQGNWARYNLTRPGNNPPQIWDVTDLHNPQRLQVQTSGAGTFFFTAATDTLREFVAFEATSNQTALPIAAGIVSNQNLHATGPQDLVIVVHPNFESQANRLADFHRGNGLRTLVVRPQQLYNEFSSGAQDITAIRDFMRMLYTKANSDGDKPKYLLLFGDASFDYKNRVSPNHNFVPIYQSFESVSQRSSFSTDDYYGFLDDGEGTSMINDGMDLGIGRLTVMTSGEARSVVDKIIDYADSPESFGPWRNRLLFVADDVEELWETVLVESAERAATMVEENYRNFNVDKIYLDAFQQVVSGGAQRYPEAREQLQQRLQAGNLITTFIGHGGPVRWTSEAVLTIDDVNNLQNRNQLPLWITITCEFTRLDDPDRVSAGERVLLNPNGGGIGLISTTRVVGVQPAVNVNNAIFDTLFSVVDGRTQTLGDLIRVSKNARGVVGGMDRSSFSLIGDPALRLASPPYQVFTDSINLTPITVFNDTITALSRMQVSGFVQDLNGQFASNYNAIVEPIVFDKRRSRTTLVNDGIGPLIPFTVRDNVIYRGQVNVVNGRFFFEFIVPLDISFSFGTGRISYYVSDREIDGAGYFEDFILGGINPNPTTDNQGPEMRLFMNDESFVSGGITDQSPLFLALVNDSSGINTTGNGIGRDITAILNGDLNQSFILNDFYQADLDSYQSGRIQYPFFNLPEGPHNIRLRIFDVFNNPSEGDLDFVVASNAGIALRHVLNYPNPFTTYTEFHFEHNRAGQPLDVQVQVFTVSGKLVKTLTQTLVSSGNRISEITWDGRDDYGDLIGRGTYVYRLRVKSQFDDAYAEKYEKLVILR